jgi:hypothetical protein
MVKRVLVKQQLDDGERLVADLQARYPEKLRSAFWKLIQGPEDHYWRLVIGIPDIALHGQPFWYSRIQESIQHLRIKPFSLSDVSAFDPNDWRYQEFEDAANSGGMFGTGPSIGGHTNPFHTAHFYLAPAEKA